MYSKKPAHAGTYSKSTKPAQIKMTTVSTKAMANLVGSPYSVALDILTSTIGTKSNSPQRIKALKAVAPLVPDLNGLVKALLALTKPSKRRRAKAKKAVIPVRGKICTICHKALPHVTREGWSLHGHYMHLYRARKNRWVKYPDIQDRRTQTAPARSTILAARHERWIAALRKWDPVRTEHLLRTQGTEGALTLFRSLSHYRRKLLLKQVPPPPKRAYKGESLVKKGLRPVKLNPWNKYSEIEKGLP